MYTDDTLFDFFRQKFSAAQISPDGAVMISQVANIINLCYNIFKDSL